MEGAGAPVAVLVAQAEEEGTLQVGDLYLEGVRGPAACVVVVEEDNYCSPVVDTLGAS